LNCQISVFEDKDTTLLHVCVCWWVQT